MRNAIIEAQNLSIGYSKTRNNEPAGLHHGLSLSLYTGELTCLLGPNGAGKSTLMRTLSGIQAPLLGTIYLKGKELSGYSKERLSFEIGLVLTDKTSVGGFTIRQLVNMGRYPYTGFFGKLSTQDKDIVAKAMQDVGIFHKSESYIAELSDGERQKAMIAKALAQECPIIFLDEPTAFLDAVSKIEIMTLLHTIASTQNKAILLSTHDIELALAMSDRLWLLSREYGLKCGVTEDIVLDNSLNDFFKRNDIQFDNKAGSFLPLHLTEQKVYIETNDDTTHWIENFLKRNNLGITESEQEAFFSLYIQNHHTIKVKKGEEQYSFASFEELYNWLKS